MLKSKRKTLAHAKASPSRPEGKRYLQEFAEVERKKFEEWWPKQYEIDILMNAKKQVVANLQERQQCTTPRTLFIETNYPFFDKAVQIVMDQRHPDKWSGSAEYAIHAYLCAEQMVWKAFDQSAFKALLRIEDQYFLSRDIGWFCRLVATISDAVEKIMGRWRSCNLEILSRQTRSSKRFSHSCVFIRMC